MDKPKSDESVKTGLQIAGHDIPGSEKDEDELVHEQPLTELPETAGQKDLDDLVHEHPTNPEPDHMTEVDEDDLVHGPDVLDDEEPV